MTWFELVRKYFPDASDDECDFLLWEKTAYPACSASHVENQLAELANDNHNLTTFSP